MLALNFQEMTEHKVKRGWYRLEHYKVELKNKLKCLIFTLDVFFSINSVTLRTLISLMNQGYYTKLVLLTSSLHLTKQSEREETIYLMVHN